MMLCLLPGLKDLADFLPASLATIISYFSAEVTRGVWKPAFMNGTDWPSPAANLQNVEEQIKKILAETGVDVPSLTSGNSKNFFQILTYNAFLEHNTMYIYISPFTPPDLSIKFNCFLGKVLHHFPFLFQH
jgi:hypothetical protein